ncbi:ABC transporter permease [Synechococcus sp. EJ6-Ellesmere]|uniref:ABC transporter permease n=1 Tax=Synechococcus sp. EJ6-Ellesmere TaxID=2823734 RepID=UPI0020CE518D|nr:ABC transporter permease [Synechococcus sp. EJ6-Ellesmere]MCP9824858.1 ABC transporter permease [Synechococcus sp. EJ6-Ellesmere]
MRVLRHWWRRLSASRLWALVRKEVQQILRDRQLIKLLIIPPTLQLLIYGFALNPEVHNLRLGVVDYAQVSASRELVSALTANRIFLASSYPRSERELARQVERGELTAGLVIPPNFNQRLAAGDTAQVQVFIDGVDANSAGIASGYIQQILRRFRPEAGASPPTPPLRTQVRFLYNPGLTSSWFFVPGVIGLVLTLIATLVSAVTLVREKDTGTLEQLLMTPAAAWEILLAKILPLVVLLMGDVLLALLLGRLVFGLPIRGNPLLLLTLSGLYLFVGIGVGIMLATVCRSQQQVMLTAFFITLPMVQTSGAIAPIESMPVFFQVLSLLNPLRHFIAILRGLLLKGVGLEALWPHALALLVMAPLLMAISVLRFRSQLS